MRATFFPCDWAESINGKLYAQGVGWSRIGADIPCNVGLALLIHVEYNETNLKHKFVIKLEEGDGLPYPPDSPLGMGGDFEVGRPPGMQPGEETVVPIAANVNQITIGEGAYTWRVLLDDEPVAYFPFIAMKLPGGGQ